MMNDIELLSIQFQTLFLITSSGRIERENDPDHSPGPRLYLAGCASGNVAGVRSDVTDDLAAEIMSLVTLERPFFTRDGCPQYFDRYIELLSREGTVRKQSLGVIYELPNDLEYEHGVPLNGERPRICLESPESLSTDFLCQATSDRFLHYLNQDTLSPMRRFFLLASEFFLNLS
jgi:hypothetical protein